MMEEFKPGDLLRNKRYKGCLYLVVAAPDTRQKYMNGWDFLLVKIKDEKKLSVSACNLSDTATWNNSHNLHSEKFYKVGSIIPQPEEEGV